MVLARDQRVSEMLADAEEKDASITALQQDIADKESAMIELSGELRSAQEEVGGLTSVRGELEEACRLLKQDRVGREATLESLQKSLHEHVLQLQNLGEEHEESMRLLRQDVEDKEAALNASREEVARLTRMGDEQESVIIGLRQDVADKNDGMAKLSEESARVADVMAILEGQLEKVGAAVEQVETQCSLLQGRLAREQLSRQQCERQLEEALHQVLQVEQIRAAAERERELERVHEKESLETSLESACCERSRIQADCDGSVPPSNPPPLQLWLSSHLHLCSGLICCLQKATWL